MRVSFPVFAGLLFTCLAGAGPEAVFSERDHDASLKALAADLETKLAAPVKPLDPGGFGENLRMRLLNPASFGIPAEVTDPTQGYNSGAYAPVFVPGKLPPETLAAAQHLLSDKRIGAPGQVNWETVQGRYGAWAITPLALAYLETGEARYLQRWCAYLDDWALREHVDFWPIHCPPEHSKGAPATLQLIKLWGGIAKHLAGQSAQFPTNTLLRCLNKLLPGYPLMSVAHHRGNPRNWTVENAWFYSALGFYLDDFTVGRELQREGLRVIESYAVTHNMRDGTENQQMLGYNLMYPHSAMKITALWDEALRTGKLPPHTRQLVERTAWRELLTVNRRDRVIRMLRMVTPETRAPATLRTDLREYPLGELSRLFPEKDLDPETLGMLEWFRSNKKGMPPAVTSEHFPYGGYTLIRSGWSVNDSQGFFFSSPKPGATAGFNSERNNNALTVSAFGDEVLVAGDRGAYTKRPSPIRVDGREQAFHLGLLAPLAAWDAPSGTRFHSTENLVLAEGLYAGPYGIRRDDGDADALQRRLETALWKTQHHRVVVLIKPATWIVFDEMTSDAPREYALDLRLPLEPAAGSKNYRPFKMPDIEKHDTPVARIIAHRPQGTHASLTFTATSQAKLQLQEERNRRGKPGAPVSDFCKITAVWRGEKGPSGIISFIQPWRGASAPAAPTDISDDKQIGLVASGSDNQQLVARMARSGTSTLVFGDLRADTRKLVAWTPSAGETRGVALGCRQLLWKGKAVTFPAQDFEFHRTAAGEWVFQEIFRPVETVQVHPSRALLDSREPVALSCATPGTEIRYTLDGSPVTTASPRYTAPIAVEKTTWLRARAFRRGTPPNAAFEHNNLSSPETRAALHRADSAWSAVSTGPNLTAGLKETSARGNWSALWLGSTGGASGPDTLHISEGFIIVPATGIYTFHAPEELTHDNRAAGYDLQLTVDGKTWFPETQRHAFGTWSVPLEKGAHRLTIRRVDFRRDAVARLNKPGALLNPIWDGNRPEVLISGPGTDEPRPIPASWLFRWH